MKLYIRLTICAILGFTAGFALMHCASSQERPWIAHENATTIELQAQAEEARLRAAAQICGRIIAHHPHINLDTCLDDPSATEALVIKEENAKREARYIAQQAEHERLMKIYQQQQAEYQRQLEEWRAKQQEQQTTRTWLE